MVLHTAASQGSVRMWEAVVHDLLEQSEQVDGGRRLSLDSVGYSKVPGHPAVSCSCASDELTRPCLDVCRILRGVGTVS